MVFNSLIFVVFFAVVLFLHSMPFSWRVKKVNLLIASYIFYAAWNPPFVILLWLSTVVDWFAAQGLVKADRPGSRRAWMLLSVVANLGMLLYFKYGAFLLENFTSLMNSLGITQCCPQMLRASRSCRYIRLDRIGLRRFLPRLRDPAWWP